MGEGNSKGITFIVPFYNGNKYMSKLLSNIEKLYELVSIDIELIIVNDSPDIEVELPVNENRFPIHIINNDKNCGIHYSRVTGVQKSKYQLIQFIDQDDELVPGEYSSQLANVDYYDLTVGNGINVGNYTSKRLYKNLNEMNMIINEKEMLSGRNYIRSPGQCIIRKDSIPSFWMENIMSENGADDWFLWLLMLNSNARILLNDRIVYLHNQYEGENLSLNYEKMRESSLHMCELLEKNTTYNKSKITALRRTIEYRHQYLTNDKSISCIKYADLYIKNAVRFLLRKTL